MAEHTRRRVTRRELLLSLAPASAAFLATGVHAQDPLPHLEEGDPAAKALGYVHDVARVDPKANPTFKAGSNCANCLQLQGKPGDTWRPCTIFPGRLVNANGWCKVWVPKK